MFVLFFSIPDINFIYADQENVKDFGVQSEIPQGIRFKVGHGNMSESGLFKRS